ncbi:MAG TPA: M20/M25/M40 family metallo-hydrolase [Pseudogracilibacillus sp.]|nr:M20/M25/M40 family metallo-hydrolase [Pseudogracilibacillus sp.]
MKYSVDNIIATFKELVKIESITGNEKQMSHFLSEKLTQLGSCIETYPVKSYLSNGYNIISRIQGTVDDMPPLFFATHLDTVEHDQAIRVEVGDEYITSTSQTILAADPKMTIAIFLEMITLLKEGKIDHGPIEFVFTVCEEQGGLGASSLKQIKANHGYVVDHTGQVGTIVQNAYTSSVLRFILKSMTDERITKQMTQLLKHLRRHIIDKSVQIQFEHVETNFVEGKQEIDCTIRLFGHNYVRIEDYYEDLFYYIDDFAQRNHLDCEYLFGPSTFGYEIDEADPLIQLFKASVEKIDVTPRLIDTVHLTDANIFHGIHKKHVTSIGVGFEHIHTIDERILISEVDKLTQVLINIVQLNKEGSYFSS